jgi:hypothetical protein
MSNNTVSNLALAAAFAGLLGGTTARLNAQPTLSHSEITASSSPFAGVLVAADQKELPKHACKGQNDCKGQGGGDKKHAGKNACKGKGACATDGSTPPKS